MEYLNDMQDVYKNIEDYNPEKKRKVSIVFDDMIADMISNTKLNPIVKGLFIRGRTLSRNCLYHVILLQKAKRCKIKFYTLFYYKNSK